MRSEFTDEMLRQIMPHCPASVRREQLPLIVATMRFYGITNELRASAFLATLAQESGEFKYRTELASGAAYEGRRDLGNTRPGDGKRFKGRGRIQITGRANVAEYSEYVRERGHIPAVDFIAHPERLAEDPYALDSAGWFFAEFKHLNELADRRQFLAISIKVNGRNRNGLPNHWQERRAYYERALRVLPDNFNLGDDEDSARVSDEDFSDVDEAENLGTPSAEATREGGGAVSPVPLPPPGAFTSSEMILGESIAGEVRRIPEQPRGTPPGETTEIEQIAPRKERTQKSLTAAIAAFFAFIATPFYMFKDALFSLAAGADNRALILLSILCGAGVLIYWKYQDRQTRLDEADRNNAAMLTREKMRINSDPDLNSITLSPNTTPPTPAEAEAGDLKGMDQRSG